MYKVGFSEIKVIPQGSFYLSGYAARWGVKSTGIHDPLYAKAFYIEQEKIKTAFITLDLVGIPYHFVNSVRCKAKKQLGIENIIIACTHTHSAPETTPQIQLDNDQVDFQWMDWLEGRVLDVLKSSMENKMEVKIGATVVDVAGVAKNRRKGKTVIDPALCVVKIEDMSGNIRGILLNYTCHATILDASNLQVSADYPGYIYKILAEKYPGVTTLFTNGAAGDINIGYSADSSALGVKMDIRTYENAERKAKIICDRVLAIISEIPVASEGVVNYISAPLQLPLKDNLPTIPEIDERIKTINIQIDQTQEDLEKTNLKIQMIYLLCLKNHIFHYVKKDSNHVEAEAVLLSIGNLLFVTVPGELFSEAGMKIKKEFSYQYKTAIVGYANGDVGYIPTREAFEEGGYEAETTIFSNEVADTLLRSIKNVKDELLSYVDVENTQQ